MDIDKLRKTLEKDGYMTSFFETGEEAARYIAGKTHGTTVGIGGSMTVKSIGLFEMLQEDNEVFWHWVQEPDTARANAMNAKVYISSANAIAETGEIINIDGNGNRVAAITYAKEKVYIIAGVNKIEKDFDRALWRARNIAAPLNARRFNLDTPCVKGDLRCYDCSSPSRICRSMSVLLKKPNGVAEMEIVLINQELGY